MTRATSLSAGVICVFGGHGFLGTAVSRRLRAFGHDVVTVGRAPRVDPDYFPISAKAALIKRLGQGPVSAFIDLASGTVPQSSFDDPIDDLNTNLRASIERLELAILLKPAIYVLTSSGGTVYGDVATVPIREIDATRPKVPYGVTKLASEHYAHMFESVSGLELTIVRPANVYGPGQSGSRGQGLVATAIECAIQNKPLAIFGDGTTVRDYLYIDDFTNALLAVLSLRSTGAVFNIGSGVGTTTRQLLDLIASTLAVDNFPLKCTAEPARPFDVDYNVLDCTRLHAATGWSPKISLEDGIRRTWNTRKAALR